MALRAAVLAAGGLVINPAMASKFSLELGPGFDIEWKNKFAAGAQWRLEKPDQSLIGKSNLDPSLCAEDACIALRRDNLEPHQRWMAAPGGNWQIGDEANLIHDQYDMTSAVVRWRSDMTVKGGDGSWGFKLGWQTFYDDVLYGLQMNNPNIMTEEGPAPGASIDIEVPGTARGENGKKFDLREAYGFFRLPYGDGRELDVKIGRQYMGWGEALFAISGTLNFINPVNFNNFFRPAMDLDEALEPVGLINLRTQITEEWGLEAFYQLEWRPYQLPTRGSLGSFIADIGTYAENSGSLADDSFPLPFGKTPEDPLQLQRELTSVVALISDTAASVPRLDNREPHASGQYGFKASLFEEEWLGGTEISVYFSNYHARLPAASFYAADPTCASAEGSATGEDPQPGPFPVGLINFLRACGRDVDNVVDLVADLSGDNPKLVGDGYDALPIDTARLFLEFPKNIKVFGIGFNTSALGLNWTGELAYRPDHPFQVDLEDVFFTALQPIFPRNELELVPADGGLSDNAVFDLLSAAVGLPLGDLAGATFTDRRNAIPDYLTAYRGGTPGEVTPNSYVRGYEEFDYWHGSVGGTWLFGPNSNWLKADQLVTILEFAASYVPDLPALNELQLDSLGTTNTHYSIGIEESGDALKLNPFQQDEDGFPTKLAWGYKAAAIWAYNDAWLDGLRIRPQLILFHDVDGTTPGLGGNFQHGRKIGLAGVAFNYKNTINFSIDQFIFFGGGKGNRLNDRDFINVAVSYQF